MRRVLSACNSLALALLASSQLSGCVTEPAPRHPRTALPLPPEVAARYALPGPVIATHEQTSARGREVQGELRAGAERVRFHLLLPEGRPRPLVLLVPILSGGDSLMQILAGQLAGRGYAAGYCERAGSAMRPPQHGPDLELLFRRTVVQNRMLLAWARTSPLVRGQEAFVLGISMGGMVGTVLTAVEPDVRAAVLCLAGGDLGDLVLHSREGRVLSWIDWRRSEEGAGRGEIETELRRSLLSDPARLAPYVTTERVLMVSALFDDVVPARNQDLLWEGLGRPRRMFVPTGHYTAALAINPILDAAGSFYASAPASSVGAPPVP
jgi:dienelactone hydrolase